MAGYGQKYDSVVEGNDTVQAARVIAHRIMTNRAIYDKIQDAIGVPWFMAACIHYRESNLNFATHMHNGDPLTARTVHVPKGRPVVGNPPFAFIYSVKDAFEMEPHEFQKIKKWSLERILYECERYNGMGYLNHGMDSPYLWSQTNYDPHWKYVADGQLEHEQDRQMGIVPIIIALAAENADVEAAIRLRDPNAPADVVERQVKQETQTAKRGTTAGTVIVASSAGTHAAVPNSAPTSIAQIVIPLVFIIGMIVFVASVTGLVSKMNSVPALLKEKWG